MTTRPLRGGALVFSGDIPEVKADGDHNVLVRKSLSGKTGVAISEGAVSVAPGSPRDVIEGRINEVSSLNGVDVTSQERS